MTLATYIPAFSNDLPLVRPLLRVSRGEVLEYCKLNRLEPFFDETNQDTNLLRNRVRLELVPQLQSYNPNIQNVLLRTAEVLAGQEEVLQAAVASAWEKVVELETDREVKINRTEFLILPRPLQREVFRRAVASLSPRTRDIDFEATERFIALSASLPRPGEADLVSGLSIGHTGGSIWLLKDRAALPREDWPQLERDEVLPLEVPGHLRLGSGWVLETKRIEKRDASHLIETGISQFEDRVLVDADLIARPLAVRTRRPGDRISPLGLAGKRQKVSDLMINRKIPPWARDGWPLILSGGEILWIPRHRLSENFRINPETRNCVELALIKIQGD